MTGLEKDGKEIDSEVSSLLTDTRFAAEKSRELKPEEVAEALNKIKDRYCTQFGITTGAEIIFPAGTMMGDMDLSGKSLEFALDTLHARLVSYEPPIVQQGFEAEVAEKIPEVPVWLVGHENLMWKGAHDNPLWEVKAKQNKNEVTLFYERRGMVLAPGRDKNEQNIELKSLKNNFTLEEWKILQKVFNEYLSIEEGDDKSKILSVLKEENLYRKGKGGAPVIIQSKIEEAIDFVAKTTRGFKKESIDVQVLTQNAAEILSQLLVLNRTRGDGKDRVPKVDSSIKEIPSFVLNMQNLVECFFTQDEYSKGVALMIGEAGTGKNVAVEYFAASTNRPFFWFPCGRGMEAIDLVAHYEFTTEEGTKRFLTDLVRGLQTPGAVVMIDEVNSLKPEVQAMLHGLGDGNRTIKYDGIRIPVADDVLVVIAGNPATYGSAGNLGEALLSRTRGQSMVMEYPALTKGELIARKEKWSDDFLEQREKDDNTLKDYACDEALVLYTEFNEFSGLSLEEFSLLWDVIVNEATQGSKITEVGENEKTSRLVTGAVGDHVKKILVDMRDMLRISDNWRKRFEMKSGGLDIVGVSIRDTIALVRAYKKTKDVRKAFLTLIDDYKKDPIDGLKVTYGSVEQLINDVLGSAL